MGPTAQTQTAQPASGGGTASACVEHDFQWHPLSDDFAVCSVCGEDWDGSGGD